MDHKHRNHKHLMVDNFNRPTAFNFHCNNEKLTALEIIKKPKVLKRFNPLPDDKILDWSKEITEDIIMYI